MLEIKPEQKIVSSVKPSDQIGSPKIEKSAHDLPNVRKARIFDEEAPF